VTDWLSFWSKETREENAKWLTGQEVKQIYVPYGDKRVVVGDRVYCVGIEAGGLLLITRIDATAVKPDKNPKHIRSVLVDGAKNGFGARYDRPVPDLTALKYLRVKSKIPEPIKLTPTGVIVHQAYQGPSSIRKLKHGADELNKLLAKKPGVAATTKKATARKK
jgi:hypothetical protein